VASVTNPAFWLTARRVRMHGFLLALCLWSVYAADMATPGLRDRGGSLKGTDFVQFYNLGSLALHGRGDLLYALQAQTTWMHGLVPASAGMFFAPFYGPQLSLFFEPFARVPYTSALVLWLALNFLIYGVCCYLVWHTCPNLASHRFTVVILAFAFPGFFHLITFGQTSAIPLLCFTLAYLALRADRHFLAGLAIGTIIFKPQFGLAVAVVFLIAREWKAIAGAILAAVAQLGLADWHYGWPVMPTYFHALLHSTSSPALLEPHLYQSFSLRGFWILIAGQSAFSLAAYILTAAAVLAATVYLWLSPQPLSIRYSGLLLATVLVAPHCNVYDLVILAPAFLLLGDWALAHLQRSEAGYIKWLLYFCYLLFLLEPLTKLTHIQLGVLGLVVLLWLNFRIAGMPRPTLINSAQA
jgi:Glycosyltransferase family 87